MTGYDGILAFGNSRKIETHLADVIGPDATLLISEEIAKQSSKIFALGVSHYNFAKTCPRHHWRQKVSRLYYACYNSSKAIRYYKTGVFSSDVGDHKKIDVIPDNFPEKERFKSQLGAFRTCRNQADYDHLVKASDLAFTTKEIFDVTKEFLLLSKKYLIENGCEIRNRI